ncbi:MAG: hypothetical protein JST82_06220 [Bacteroidetes bacterium]|nr:hypothetical protein [Bacteroidota bacterium]
MIAKLTNSILRFPYNIVATFITFREAKAKLKAHQQQLEETLMGYDSPLLYAQ